MTIGEAISRARKEKSYTYEKLANLAGITVPHLKNLECGSQQPSFDLLKLLAISLNMSVDDVIYPRKSDDSELFRKLENRLRLCDEQDLTALLSFTLALERIKDALQIASE